MYLIFPVPLRLTPFLFPPSPMSTGALLCVSDLMSFTMAVYRGLGDWLFTGAWTPPTTEEHASRSPSDYELPIAAMSMGIQ